MNKFIKLTCVLMFSSVLFLSCGDVDKKDLDEEKETNITDLDEGIENEEDFLEAFMTLAEAKIELINKAIVSKTELDALSDRLEEIEEAREDLVEVFEEEEWTEKDMEDADNWDEYEDLNDKFEDLEDDYNELDCISF